MNITLGINSNHADSSCSIFIDNELVFGIEEERLNRIKHWAGFPEKSIEKSLSYIKNNNINEIDVAINTNPFSNIKEKSIYGFKNYILGKKKLEIFSRLSKKIKLRQTLERKFNYKFKIKYIDHHLSHISSAYYPSGFKKAFALSVDGFGDFCSLVIAKCENGKINVIDKIYYPNSLGIFYEGFTQFLGFENYGDEYKVMGLSSYGKPKYYDLINDNFFNKGNSIELNLNLFNHQRRNFVYNFDGIPRQNAILNKKTCHLFDVEKLSIKNNFQYVSDIASSLQLVFEKKLNFILENLAKSNFSSNLVLSGGCALNSLFNGKILEKKIFKNIFVPYSAGDSGGGIGAGLFYLSNFKKYSSFKNIRNPYIGTNYSPKEIDLILSKFESNKFKKIYFSTELELNQKVVELLINSKIIGWFSGKMEYGPRSLGNRAILANPADKNMKEIINSKIKRRENFRPFAPVILIEEKKNWFRTDSLNPFMSFVETILPDKRIEIPSVTHVDGTGRVQTIDINQNPKLYKLIKQFYKRSNIPLLLNTSFNENEPIVENPSQAIDCFLRTGMDALILENILLVKNDN